MLGLTLEGGGAKGSYHCGAIKALYEHNLKFNGVTGTSIGAINGAILAQGTPERLFSWWEDMVPSHLFDSSSEYVRKAFTDGVDRETFFQIVRFIRKGIANGGFPTDGFRKLVLDIIDEDKLRASDIDYGLVTYSLSDNAPIEAFKEEIPYGFLHDYIMASAYFPAFKISPLYGKKYIDGGLYNNLPINPLVRKGYEEIYAIRTLSNMPSIEVVDDTVKVHYITPSQGVGNTYSLTVKRVCENIKMGYFDAQRVLKGYGGLYFYLKPSPAGEFDEFLSGFSDEIIFNLCAALDMEKDSSRENIWERFFSVTGKYLKFSRHASYEDIFVGFIEKFAKNSNFDRYCFYALPELFYKLKEHYHENPPAHSNRILGRSIEEMFYIMLEVKKVSQNRE